MEIMKKSAIFLDDISCLSRIQISLALSGGLDGKMRLALVIFVSRSSRIIALFSIAFVFKRSSATWRASGLSSLGHLTAARNLWPPPSAGYLAATPGGSEPVEALLTPVTVLTNPGRRSPISPRYKEPPRRRRRRGTTGGDGGARGWK